MPFIAKADDQVMAQTPWRDPEKDLESIEGFERPWGDIESQLQSSEAGRGRAPGSRFWAGFN
jgi:hypothetical protein